jgi:cytochrome c oxidase subunit 2
VLGAVLGGVLILVNPLPSVASEEATRFQFLWQYMILICSILFGLVTAILVASLTWFRGQRRDMSDGPPIHGITWLEIAWTAVPTVIVVSIVVFSWIVLNRNNPSSAAASTKQDVEAAGQTNVLEVNVVGYQFNWDYDLPQYDINASTELVVPVNRDILMRISGRLGDVIHSFWVPAWRIQMNTVPGKVVSIGVKPTKEGDYAVVCAFLCGTAHAQMNSDVEGGTVSRIRVVSNTEFEQWTRETRAEQQEEAQQDEAAAGGAEGGGETTTGAGE